MEDLLYRLALTRIPNVGPITAKNLLSYCGGPEAVFRASRKELAKIPGVGPAISKSILSGQPLEEAGAEVDIIIHQGIKPIFFLDSDYPSRLLHYPDSPVMLFLKGGANLNAERIISIIGTRKPSPLGMAWCEEFIQNLAPHRPLIVSGLAYGIDICAHRKALELGLPTLAVLGHGLGHLYPAAHRADAWRMLGQGGLLSEFSFNTEPEKEYFPLRNRIVAALCDALVVVETGMEGGSMITAQFANDYNKDVFAVPGRVRDPHSAGCNHLIKTHRATLMESAADFLYVMRWEEQIRERAVQKQLFTDLTEDEKIIVDLLRQTEASHIDALCFQTRKPSSAMAALLLELEFKGLVRSLPGQQYVLVS